MSLRLDEEEAFIKACFHKCCTFERNKRKFALYSTLHDVFLTGYKADIATMDRNPSKYMSGVLFVFCNGEGVTMRY
jgi:hypothetical protein